MSQTRYPERGIRFAAEAIGVIIASLLCALFLPHSSFREYLLAAVIVAVLLGVPIAIVLNRTFPKTVLPMIHDWSSSRDQRARAALGQPPRKEGDPVEVERVLEVDLRANGAFQAALVGLRSLLVKDGPMNDDVPLSWRAVGDRRSTTFELGFQRQRSFGFRTKTGYGCAKSGTASGHGAA
jgi:hypothetical protein